MAIANRLETSWKGQGAHTRTRHRRRCTVLKWLTAAARARVRAARLFGRRRRPAAADRGSQLFCLRRATLHGATREGGGEEEGKGLLFNVFFQ